MSVLVDGIFKVKAGDKLVRERLYRQRARKGSAYLHTRLKKVDPAAAKKIHPNDAKRIIRALEVFEITGKPISVLQTQRNGLSADHDVRIFCLNMDRNELYRRIDSRVDAMFEAGLVNEVKKLIKSGLSKTSCTALGIKEVKGSLEGLYNLEEAKRLLKLNTRHYAKRQLTWFRKDKRIRWLEIKPGEKPSLVADKIMSEL
jgi:tRNA dimethylallyltransferase